ncbi:MAG TPA: Na+/H+ antiporter NhaA [Terriglobales bacterium]|nr:Na+/H+ antiporter NhaA [Terriglobales bacterium]
MTITKTTPPPPKRGSIQALRSLLNNIVVSPIERFIGSEIAGGVLLVAAAVIALLWANSQWSDSYRHLWERVISIDTRYLNISEDLKHWVNDGLMALFFFLVGLEMKREMVRGELASFRKAIFPFVAAFGGMIVPAGTYALLNRSGEAVRGWGIPMATDIAFAIGVMALLGRRIPSSLRVFMLALATVDDIGAILVIAIFYTASLSTRALEAAVFLLVLLLVFRALGVRSRLVFGIVGIMLWIAVLKSGVHATIAGVILGLLTPSKPGIDPGQASRSIQSLLEELKIAGANGDVKATESVLGQMEDVCYHAQAPLDRQEHRLHPWIGYVVLPIFALSNAGVELSRETASAAFTSTAMFGVVLGLVLGKLVGIVGFCKLAVASRIASLPEQTTWRHIIGVGLLAGIGFTVSLFITELAFNDDALVADAKIGILLASLIAGIAGYVFLRFFTPALQDNPALQK